MKNYALGKKDEMQCAFLSSRPSVFLSAWGGTGTLARPSIVTVDPRGSDKKAADQSHEAQREQAASVSSMPLGQAS